VRGQPWLLDWLFSRSYSVAYAGNSSYVRSSASGRADLRRRANLSSSAGDCARLALALLTGVVVSGCGSATTSSAPPASSGAATRSSPTTPGVPGSTTGTATTAPPPAVERVITEADDRRTVKIRRGQKLEVQLHNTYWRFAAPSTSALVAIGAPVYAPRLGGGCVPGAGCGTVTARFRAARTGTTTIKATRQSCGEALRCRPGQGAFEVAIAVKS
jgi:predicted secreted protein